jgi:glycosyltransferase involved in cell wall biosynthesis
MKIAVISTPVFRLPISGYGGLEQLAYQIAEGLAKKGHEVGLFAPDGSVCPGVQVIPFGPERQVDEKTAYSKTWQHLPSFDVVLDHSWQAWSHCLREEGVLKAPVLKTCHAPVNTMFQQLPKPKVLSFVCISEDQAAHFRGLFSRDCRVCHNGVDGNYYKAIPGLKRTKRFLFLARFSSIKGPLLAIQACKKAGVGLDLVGDTQITGEQEYLQKCLAECDNEQIRLWGNATRGECVRWFSQAHAMIHPNFPDPDSGHPGFREPFGLAPVEAMLCGCPVVAGDFGAMRETIPSGDQAFVNDLPGRLVETPAGLEETVKFWSQGNFFAPEQRANLRKHALQFSVERMVNRYEELCTEAIKNPW